MTNRLPRHTTPLPGTQPFDQQRHTPALLGSKGHLRLTARYRRCFLWPAQGGMQRRASLGRVDDARGEQRLALLGQAASLGPLG
ncbi:hypothetical protein GCM10027172_12200 [Halomonas garicola]